MYNYIVHGVKYIHITIYSPFDEKLHYLQCVAIKNKAAMNIQAQVFV